MSLSILNNNKGRPRILFFSWLLFHGVLLTLLLCFAWKGFSINADFLDIIPEGPVKKIAGAERALNKRMSGSVLILVENPDFYTAASAAAVLSQKLSESGVFENFSFYVDISVLSETRNYIDKYKYNLLDNEIINLLEQGQGTFVAQDALELAFSSFVFTNTDSIEQDPFLLGESILKGRLERLFRSSGSLSLFKDILAVEKDGLWYLMMNGKLKEALSLNEENSAVKTIYSEIELLKTSFPDTCCYYSGFPFHSYESSLNAKREISIISSVSMALIIALFFFAFRSAIPASLAVFASVLSLAAALAGELLFFREIHILTFVFGATLIGCCVDYSIHYFVHLYAHNIQADFTRDTLFRSISMSFISTEICFFSLLCAPFPIIRQFAVFSVFGMASSYITVCALFPLFRIKIPRVLFNGKAGFFPEIKHKKQIFSKILLALIIAVSVLVIVLHIQNFKIGNTITNFYKPSPSLMESEKTVAAALQYNSAPWYFILAADSAEDLLQKEESLCERLDSEAGQGRLASFMASSQFIPSLKKQEQSYRSVRALLPLAETQYQTLGLPADALDSFYDDYAAKKTLFLHIDSDEMPFFIKNALSNLWLGQIDGLYYSAVMLFAPSAPVSTFQHIASSFNGVYMVNRVEDIENELNSLTKIILILFVCAYFVVVLFTRIFYNSGDTIKIAAVPLLISLVLSALLLLTESGITFFSLCAFVLVFGLGLDYMFYTTTKRKTPAKTGNRPEFTALILSYITTALSFGTLAISSFYPVHIFGATIFAGITTAFAAALLLWEER
ncbi:MAG: hypothetical protein LBV68_02425 [Spirochaetaceae bacterium]|nr:hypothetical protein [Spirochaetaceae bacterium]